MHPQLYAIATEFNQAAERLQRLAQKYSDNYWTVRPSPYTWSVSECVAHLNLTARAFLPVLKGGIEHARSLGAGAPKRYRRDPLGWLLWLASGPPARLRTRTAAAFVPSADELPEEIRATFESLQAQQIAILRAADGLPLQKIRINSPFDPRARYNLFSALTILPQHQHRHLWQAAQAARAVGETLALTKATS